jgi:hypothetical protein
LASTVPLSHISPTTTFFLKQDFLSERSTVLIYILAKVSSSLQTHTLSRSEINGPETNAGIIYLERKITKQ